jgi:hypothetical protein
MTSNALHGLQLRGFLLAMFFSIRMIQNCCGGGLTVITHGFELDWSQLSGDFLTHTPDQPRWRGR